VIDICKWCGKCSFLDYLNIHGVIDNPEKFKEWKAKTEIYVKDIFLGFETAEDLIPFYTHIIGMSYGSQEKNIIHLSSKSWLELEEERYFPSPYRLEMMHKFDEFVKANKKEPIWFIPLDERDKWNPCPLGEPYFCEPKLNNGTGTKFETKFCPYMFARRTQFPCKLQKRLDKRKDK
jgi:hypothetical protein